MREEKGRFLLDLEWRGEARTDVTIGKYDYGGLFLRMPWRQGMPAEVVNAARQRNERAEGQRAMWIDVGMQVDGRERPRACRDASITPTTPATLRRGGWMDSLALAPRARAPPTGPSRRARPRLSAIGCVVYTGTLNDVELTNALSDYGGNRSTYATQALWGIAQREGRAEKFLTPEQAASAMTMVPGYAVTAWAGEPMIQQPMAFCWDDRGRLWVAENLDYETRGRGFSKAGTSRILILEDTNRDGVADSRKVFMEGIVFPSALAVGFDGVFVGAPPNLLFVPDRNGDDRADLAGHRSPSDGMGNPGSPRGHQQPPLGPGRMAVRLAGICHALEGEKAGWQGTHLQTRRAVPRGHPAGRRRRDQRRRLAVPSRPRIGSRSWPTASAIPGASTTTPRVSSS